MSAADRWSGSLPRRVSKELGHLAVETGIWPLYEVIDGVCNLTGPTRRIPAAPPTA